MKKYINTLFICALVLFFGTSFAFAETKNRQGIGCTSEAKLCSDGSSVGRTGPNCEFAKCPSGDDRFFERDNGMLKKEKIKDNIEKNKLEKEDLEDDEEINDDTDTEEATEIQREQIKAEIEKIREEAKQKIEALREKIRSEKNKIKAKISEARIIGREQALQRFDFAIEKLNALKDNVKAKITKLEAQGINVEKAKEQVVIAETKVVEAKIKVAEASTLLSASVNELTKENKAKLKKLTQETQALIKDAHQALNEAIKFLKSEIKNRIETTKLKKALVETEDVNSATKETKQ